VALSYDGESRHARIDSRSPAGEAWLSSLPPSV
jgi:hypothetical protein